MKKRDINGSVSNKPPPCIGSRLQLFVDRFIVDKLDAVEMRLHEPVRQPMPKHPLAGGYMTVIKDGGIYRAYARDNSLAGYSKDMHGEADRVEFYRYYESRDGHEWEQPRLGLYEIKGSKDNNVIAGGGWSRGHNFCPFLDTQPGVKPSARFKAVSGGQDESGLTRRFGFRGYVSADGIHWRDAAKSVRGRAACTGLIMMRGPKEPGWNTWGDSQNVCFWSEVEKCYALYFRTRIRQPGQEKPLRAISRVTAKDFLGEWSRPVLMEANLPGENLYTSQTQPYFRAPHIYLAFPTRLLTQRGSSTDILFMSTRPGSTRYERLFKEAFIRPGPDPERWGNRANYVALNVVPTSPDEMSIYHQSGHRYVLRTDGFVSIHAGAGEGEFLTKYFKFTGSSLLINYSTSASGSIQVEIQDEQGKPLPGFRLMDCAPIIGDKIEQAVRWGRDSDLKTLEGHPVRLKFVMADCDLYSFRFGNDKNAQDSQAKK